MALKRKIDKKVYDKLSDELKAEYVEKDGDYILDVDDATELSRAKERETSKAKKEKERADKLQEELDEAKALLEEGTTVDAKKKGDITTLEKQWKDKLEKVEKEGKAKLDKANDFIRKQLVDNVANSIASEISTSPKLLLPHIRARLTADLDGDEPVTKVLDAEGKASILSIADLKKDFVANKEYASIMIGSKATGSSATIKGPTKFGSATQQNTTESTEKPKLFSSMNPSEMRQHLQAKKEAAQQE